MVLYEIWESWAHYWIGLMVSDAMSNTTIHPQCPQFIMKVPNRGRKAQFCSENGSLEIKCCVYATNGRNEWTIPLNYRYTIIISIELFNYSKWIILLILWTITQWRGRHRKKCLFPFSPHECHLLCCIHSRGCYTAWQRCMGGGGKYSKHHNGPSSSPLEPIAAIYRHCIVIAA